jgi:hypothetical protein
MADDDHAGEYTVDLWTREETPMLTVRITTDQSFKNCTIWKR